MKFNLIVNSIKKKIGNLKERFKNVDNKKSILMGGIGVLTLLIFVVGATYAYFSAQSNSGARTDVDVITGTTDLISFSFGDEINIQANETNFGQGMGNLSDSTTAQALLRANNTTNSVTTRYNIYLVIESNDFEYTTENGTPEILLNVTDPNGNLVENITGLVHYEDGFDITTRTGGFLLIPDYVISADENQTVQDWNIEVTFVNLDSDQQANTNKTLTGKIYMTQDTMSSYELTQINNFETSTTYNSITVTPEITAGSAAVEKYYYGIEQTSSTMAYNNSGLTRLSNTLAASEDVEFIESDEPSYTFSNLTSETDYTVYSYTVDENNIKSNMYSTEITTAEYELPTIDSVSHNVTLNSITVNVTASNGSNSVSKYMYKIGNEEWVETESSSYTFNNLLDTTEYDIRIKVKDSEGQESTEYYEAITTEVYILPVVTTVNAETTWNSITLTPTGTDGTNTIDHYEYSIDNGAYQTSNIFNNLTDNHEYTIEVKAIDSAGRESNVYEVTVRTDTYILPTISVSVTSTYNSISINVNATPGDGSIVSYHYSRDDGSNYTSSSNNSYTFSELTDNTTYYLRVYATDSNGRTSSVYNTSVITEVETLADTCRDSNSNSLACHVATQYNEENPDENGIYYHDGNVNGGACFYDDKLIYEIHTESDCQKFYSSVWGDYFLTSEVYPVHWNTEESVCYLEKNGENIKVSFNRSGSSTVTESQCYGYAAYSHWGFGYNWTLVTEITGNYINNYNIDSGDRSYRYSGGNYLFTELALNSGYTLITSNSSTSANNLINFYCNDAKSYYGAYCSSSYSQYYTTAYDETIHYNTYDEALNATINDKYLKEYINNYVCFGSDETVCPEENLYRIIGVFDNEKNGNYQVKLIKATFATEDLLGTNGTGGNNSYYKNYYFWGNNSNIWSESELNTINLNTNFINYLGEKWSSKIAETTWQVGGNSFKNLARVTAKETYQNEIVNPVENTTYNAKIGLIYGSDYHYGVTPEFWLYPNSSDGYAYGRPVLPYGNSLYNWMNLGAQWTITRVTTDVNDDQEDGNVLYVHNVLSLDSYTGGWDSMFGGAYGNLVHPTFYLNSDVTYISGTGTQSDPYRIS